MKTLSFEYGFIVSVINNISTKSTNLHLHSFLQDCSFFVIIKMKKGKMFFQKKCPMTCYHKLIEEEKIFKN